MMFRDELRAAFAIARKEILVELRYPLNAVNEVLQPLYQFLIPSLLLGAAFLVGGRAVGLETTTGTDDLAGYLFVGVFIGGLISATFWGAAYSFKREMDGGTLEASYLTPTQPETFLLGRALAHFARAMVASTILLGIGAVFFGGQVAMAVVGTLPVLGVVSIGLVGVAYLVAAVVLRLKEPNLIVDSTDFLFAVLSGVYFSAVVLPDPVRLAAFALPTTYALDLMRVDALGTIPLVSAPVAWLALAGVSAGWLVIGRWAFQRTDHAMRVRGTIGGH